MKDIDEIIKSAKEQIGKHQNTEDQQADMGVINLVFKNLKMIFPAWRQNFKTEHEFNLTKNLWSDTLIDEGITTQEQIERGLKGARNHDSAFFPSIGQFIKWTKKEAPRVNEQAYQEFAPKLSPYTRDEYENMAENGAKKLRQNNNTSLTVEELLAKLKG